MIEQLISTLPAPVREQVKKPKWARLIIIDSQVVNHTCKASVDSKGFCFYQATHGIKRHLAVDTLGFPFLTHWTKAHVSDDVGLLESNTSYKIGTIASATNASASSTYPSASPNIAIGLPTDVFASLTHPSRLSSIAIGLPTYPSALPTDASALPTHPSR